MLPPKSGTIVPNAEEREVINQIDQILGGHSQKTCLISLFYSAAVVNSKIKWSTSETRAASKHIQDVLVAWILGLRSKDPQ